QGRDLRTDQSRLIRLRLEVREFQPEGVARRLEITFEVLQVADFGSENREFDPAIKSVVSGAVEAKIACGTTFSEMFRLHFPDTLADPLCGSWLARPQEDFRARLGEHGLSFAAVTQFDLAAPLKSEDHACIRLSALG